MSLVNVNEDVINLFDLNLRDLVNLARSCQELCVMISKSLHIKVKQTVVYEEKYRTWFKHLDNVSLTDKTLQFLPIFSRVHTLNLSGTKVIDISALALAGGAPIGVGGDVHTLDLSRTKVIDVSTLALAGGAPIGVGGDVHTLNLSGTKVSEISTLGNVHTLNLSNTNVTNVSALGNVHTLNLSNTKVTNVSALGNVHTLYLSFTNLSGSPNELVSEFWI